MNIRLCLTLILGLTALSGIASPVTVAALNAPESHCSVLLAPIQAGETASRVLSEKCYETFAEAIFAATSGTVQLDESTNSADFTTGTLAANGVLSAAATLPFGINYRNSNYSGSTYTWSGYTSQPCGPYSYGINWMPSGWDNEVSSARTTTEMGCRNNYHHQYTYYGGIVLNCYSACSGRGVMNDRTSSERWTA